MYTYLTEEKVPNILKIKGKSEEKLLKLLEDKETPNFIGKQLGVSKDTVKSFLIKNNLPIYDKNSKKTIHI